MQALAKDCEALAAAHREIDRLRAGVVDLKAHIRSMEAQALNHGTVPQNNTQVVDFIGLAHIRHVHSCHSCIGASPQPLPTKDTVSII
jgi:hypothetical protein